MTFPDSPRQARLLGITLLAATFAIGGLSGAAATRLLGNREPVAVAPDAEERGPREQCRPSTLDQIGISPEQRQQIDGVLERRRRQTEAFWDQYGTTLRAIVDSARAEVRALLTPEQRAEYDRLRAERRRRSHEQDCSERGHDT